MRGNVATNIYLVKPSLVDFAAVVLFRLWVAFDDVVYLPKQMS